MLRWLTQGAGYWAWRALSAAAQRLPVRAVYAVALAGGDLAYLLWADKRHIALHNFSAVLARPVTDGEVTRMVRRSFRNFAKYLVDIMRFPGMSLADIASLVAVPEETWRSLAALRERGHGLIMVSIHFGSFELGGARIAHELPLCVVADDLENARIMDLLAANRSHKNITIFTPDGAAKKVLRALRRNEVVGFMMDLGPRALAFSNVTTDFFGRPTVFPAVAAELARVSGAPIVVAAVRREPDDTFHTITLEPIFVERTSDAARDVLQATGQIVRQLESLIRQWPEQWYIFRPMWPLAR